MIRIVLVLLVLVLWAATANAAPPSRVLVADSDPELVRAIDKSLAPWRIAVIAMHTAVVDTVSTSGTTTANPSTPDTNPSTPDTNPSTPDTNPTPDTRTGSDNVRTGSDNVHTGTRTFGSSRTSATADPRVTPRTGTRDTHTTADSDRAKYDRLVAMEQKDPTAALSGYLELSQGDSKWAGVALFAAGRLAADRQDRRAVTLLDIYLRRFPNGANADDARNLLARLKDAP